MDGNEIFRVSKLIANRYYKNSPHFEDLIQCGCLAILEAMPNYDESKSKEITFFSSKAKGAMSNYIQYMNRREVNTDHMQDIAVLNNEGDLLLEEVIGNADIGYEDVESIQMYEEIMKVIREGLDRRTRIVDKEIRYKMIKLRESGYTVNETANILGVSQQRVSKMSKELQDIILNNMEIHLVKRVTDGELIAYNKVLDITREFSGTKEASEELGLQRGTIANICNKDYGFKSAKGWKFSWKR